MGDIDILEILNRIYRIESDTHIGLFVTEVSQTKSIRGMKLRLVVTDVTDVTPVFVYIVFHI